MKKTVICAAVIMICCVFIWKTMDVIEAGQPAAVPDKIQQYEELAKELRLLCEIRELQYRIGVYEQKLGIRAAKTKNEVKQVIPE